MGPFNIGPFNKSIFVILFGGFLSCSLGWTVLTSRHLVVNKERLSLFSFLYFLVTEGSDEGPIYLWNTCLHDV